jgi:dolichol-phosphate mannosyltransferase
MLSVIVPTYEEKENLRELLTRALATFGRLDEPAELLIVDDNSPDGTAAAAESLAAELGAGEQVRVLLRTEDRGLAKAVIAGFAAARGDVLAVMDADLSHPPELLADMMAAIRGGADVAVGSRYVAGGGTVEWPWWRQVISRVAAMLARPLVGFRDTTSGFFALRRASLEGVELKPRGYKIGLEIIARLRRSRVVEVPFVFRDRRFGSSKLSGAVMGAYLVQLGALYRDRFPVLVGYLQFGLVGLLGVLVDAAVFTLGYWYLGLAELGPALGGFLAQSVSFVVAASSNYFLNAAWTFRDRAEHGRLSVFVAISAVGFLLRSLLFEVIVAMTPAGGVAGVLAREQLALFSGILVASVWNYFGSRRWAFPAPAHAPAAAPLPEELAAITWAVGLLAAAAALRIVFATITPLSYDEAYYWQWSRHLAWGYYDHPPMIAYLVASGSRLLGSSELGVRLVPLSLALATAWMIGRLARDYWGTMRAGLWAMACALFAPLFAVGGIITTPDVPLLFFWTATLLLALRALRTARTVDWLLAGAAAGLGLLSKYSMVLLFPALLLALLSSSRGRQALKGAGPYIALLSALAVVLPTIFWQLEEGGAGVLFQLQHGFGPGAGGKAESPGMAGFARFLASQGFLLTPLLFAMLVWALVRAVRENPGTPVMSSNPGLGRQVVRPFLVYAALVPAAVFALASFFAESGGNWSAPVYATGFALLGGELARLAARRASRWQRALTWAAMGLAASVSVYVHVEAFRPLYPYRVGALTTTAGHRELARWADELMTQHSPSGNARIVASDYKLASVLAFYMRGQPQTYDPFEQKSGSAYLRWQDVPAAGETGLYITTRRNDTKHKLLFTDSRAVGEQATVRAGVTVRGNFAYFGTLNPEAFGRD